MYHRGRKIASKNFFTILPSRDYNSPCVEALLAGCHVMHNDAARPAANTCTQTLLRIEQQFSSLFKKMARCGIRPAPQKGGKEKKRERERVRQLRAGGQGGWGVIRAATTPTASRQDQTRPPKTFRARWHAGGPID